MQRRTLLLAGLPWPVWAAAQGSSPWTDALARDAVAAVGDDGRLLLVPELEGRHVSVGTVASIESRGELPSGETWADFAGFRKVLRDTREDLFVKGLIRSLLTHATGRHLERFDDYEVEEILARVKADHLGLQTLVVEVIGSEIFRSR